MNEGDKRYMLMVESALMTAELLGCLMTTSDPSQYMKVRRLLKKSRQRMKRHHDWLVEHGHLEHAIMEATVIA